MTSDSALTAYPKGDKNHVHISLYQRHLTVLDQAAAYYACSRAEFIEALLDDWSKGLMPGVEGALDANRKEPKK